VEGQWVFGELILFIIMIDLLPHAKHITQPSMFTVSFDQEADIDRLHIVGLHADTVWYMYYCVVAFNKVFVVI